MLKQIGSSLAQDVCQGQALLFYSIQVWISCSSLQELLQAATESLKDDVALEEPAQSPGAFVSIPVKKVRTPIPSTHDLSSSHVSMASSLSESRTIQRMRIVTPT